MRIVVTFFLYILFLLPVCSNALTCGSNVKPNAVYINGVWNDWSSANENRDALESFLISQSLRSRFDKIILAFNDTHGTFQDLYDVLEQKEQEGPAVWKKVVNLMARFTTIGPSVLIDTATQSDASLGSVVTTLTGKILDGLTMKDYIDADFVQVVADIAGTAGNANLLLIPHSQGCLYANRVYQQYAGTSRKVSISGIANPSSSMPAGEYVTSSSDTVISWLRTLYTVLPSTTTIEKHPDGSMGHTFVFDYLGMPVGQSAIAAMITRQLLNTPEITIGGLPVTLSWSDGSPLTLWVSDGGELHSAIGFTGSATYTICEPQNFTFYFAWVSSIGGWPVTSTLSAGGKSVNVNLASLSDLFLWGDGTTRRLAGSVFIDQAGSVSVQ